MNEENNVTGNTTNIFIIFFIIVLILGSIFEIGLFIYAYKHADSVKCNLIWCEFKSTDKIEITNELNFSNSNMQECFINNKEVNCSEVDEYMNKFDRIP